MCEYYDRAYDATGRTVYFRGGKVATLKERLGAGCSRACYDTDYSDIADAYVCKVAKNYHAISQNRFEYALYKHCQRNEHDMLKELPHFAAISPCGVYLLVEKCNVASEYIDKVEEIECWECGGTGEIEIENDEGEEETVECEDCGGKGTYEREVDIEELGQNELEYFAFDTHEDNWGYTYDGRPVILDIGCNVDEVADMVDMPDTVFTSTQSATKFDRRRERSKRIAA